MPPSGIVGWWPGDSSGDVAGANPALLLGGAATTTSGRVGSAFQFDGTNGFGQFPNSSSLQPAQLTVEGWIRFDGLDTPKSGGSPAGEQFIVFHSNTRNNSSEGFSLSKVRDAAGDRFSFTVTAADGTLAQVQSATLISTGLWYHVAAVRGANQVELYVNGGLEGQAGAAFAQDYGSAPWYLATTGQSNWDHKFKGALDELTFYDRPLSLPEIEAIQEAGASGKCQLPVVTSAPSGAQVPVGSTLVLQVAAVGLPPLAYQWLRDGTNLVNGPRVSGANGPALTISNVLESEAGVYSVVVSNPRGSLAPLFATVTVATPPVITLEPSPAVYTAPLGSTPVFISTASGTEPLFYHWLKDGTNLLNTARIEGVNGPYLKVTDIRMSDAGRYRLLVTNALGATTSREVVMRVIPVGTWGDNNNGESDMFRTTTNMLDAIAVAAGSDYNLVLRSNGTVESWGLIPPAPPEATNCVHLAAGESHALALRRDGTVVAWGQNSSGEATVPADLLEVATISAGFNHSLALKRDGTVVSWGNNGYGQASVPAGLRDVIAIAAGHEFSWALKSDGTLAGWGKIGQSQIPAYGLTNLVAIDAEWVHGLGLKSDGTVVGWGDNSFQQTAVPVGLSSVLAIAGGYVHSLALKSHGTVVAWGRGVDFPIAPPPTLANVVAMDGGMDHSIALVENPTTPIPPEFWWEPPDRAAATNGTTVFKPSLLGSLPIDFQWFFNGAPLAGQTNQWLLLSQLQAAQSGAYQLFATNRYGTAASRLATLDVLVPPGVLQQPEHLAETLGGTGTFSALVYGSEPLTYQWFFQGAPMADGIGISGSTTTQLSLANLQPSAAGSYWLVVSNPVGVITSAVATLDVLAEPKITLQPATHYGLVTRATTFTVSASGVPPLSYQWFFNGSPVADGGWITGSTTPSLSIWDVQPTNAGAYWVVISNSWGAATSVVANLDLAYVRYVNVSNTAPAAPYTNWATAARIIQDAINAAGPGDLVLVARGVYGEGSVSAGKPYYAGHRISLDKPLSVVSVSGPEMTTILARNYPYPAWGRRGAYLTNGALLAGFGITAGEADVGDTSAENQRGAGVLCQSTSCIVSNCTISGNVAGRYGGGVYSGTLINCVISGNTVRDISGARAGDGGGTYGANLVNCTVVNNSARYRGGGISTGAATNCLVAGNTAVWGGGSAYATVVNCTVVKNQAYDDGGLGGGSGGGVLSGTVLNSIVVQNTGPYGGANFWYPNLSYSCTSPHPGGVGNITDDPAFFELTSGNYRLQPDSPCINAGTPVPSLPGTDLDGLPRVVDGALDMGAYEAQHLPWVVEGATSASVLVGSNALFEISAIGVEPISYYWHKDGTLLQDGGRISGAATRSLAISAVSAENGGDYWAVISNSLGWATSRVATLTILFPPGIEIQPTNQSVALGAPATFDVTASGTEPLSYVWRKDGANLVDGPAITGTGTATLRILNAGTNDVGSYQVRVASPHGSVLSETATLLLLPLGITNQPLSRAVPAGTNISLAVGATGLPTITYQWRFNQVDLPGHTNAYLWLTNVQAWNQGDYDVIVTNDYSALTSTVAKLTVVPAAPLITKQPASAVVSVRQSVSFTVAAKGSEPMTCQWQREGTNLPGADSFTLTLDNVNSSLNGSYRAAVSNTAGFAFTTNFTLVATPVHLWGRTDYGQIPGGMGIPAAATNILAVGAGDSSYPLPCVALRADGVLLGWGGIGRIPSNAVDVVAISTGGPGPRKSDNNLALRSDGKIVHWFSASVPALPAAVSNGAFVAVAAGGTHQLALTHDGTVMAWAWGGNNFATNVPASATNVIAIAAGENHSLALRADGSVVAWGLNSVGQVAALAAVTNATAISAGGNQSLALCADGSAAGLAVTNSSPTALLYGPPPADDTNLLALSTGYAHTLAMRSDGSMTGWGQTNYSVLNPPPYLTNLNAFAAGSSHNLGLVRDPFAPPILPRIARPPLGRTIIAGQQAVFNALALGDPPLTCQWYRNDLVLEGQTNAWLLLTNPLPADAGDYYFVATNPFGSATSSVATVSVSLPQPQLLAPVLAVDGFAFSFASLPGVIYVTEYSTNLAAAAWTELERRPGTGALITIADIAPGDALRFYRVCPLVP